MDGVLADFPLGFDARCDALGERAALVPRSPEHRTWNFERGLAAAERAIVAEVFASPGLFAELAPIDGAVEAAHEMLAEGHDVRIVTAPMTSNPTCLDEKRHWVVEHLGESWLERLVITRDKTIVRGDILIDDRPSVTGDMAPEWEHVLFGRYPYNRGVTGCRRLGSWAEDWRTLVP